MTKTDQHDEELKAVDIPIGISACVLGQEVRYNGGHKLDRFIRDTLGTYVRFVPVCPEVEIGLGIPRETLRLVRGDENSEAVRLVAPKSDTDQQAGAAETAIFFYREIGEPLHQLPGVEPSAVACRGHSRLGVPIWRTLEDGRPRGLPFS